MSGPKAASKTASGGPAISAGDRKLIAFVKEVATNHSEEEIYAMLKECNRNPDEAAQRLLNEDNFHVVKRKKDRKKEVGTNKDVSDSRQGNSGSFSRGGKSYGTSGGRGSGRGTSLSRANNNERNGGRSRAPAVKENGIPSYAKTPSATLGASCLYSQLVQPKASFNDNIDNGLPSSNGDLLQPAVTSSLGGAWPASSGFGTSAMLQGAWLAGSGHGTIADMLKGGARKSSSTSSDVNSAAPVSTSLEQLSVSSMHLSPLDSVASLSYDPHARSPGSAAKRETMFSGNLPSYGLQDGDSGHYVQANNSNALSVERDIGSLQVADSNHSEALEEQVQSASGFLSGQSHSVSDADVQEGQTGGLAYQFSGAPGYQHQQFVESQKDNDRGSHLITHEEDPPVGVISENTVLDGPPSPAPNLQETSACDNNHSVIIPDHIRVSEADCTMLSFGSFDVGFDGISANPSFVLEDKNRAYENAAVNDLTVDMRSLSTSTPPPAILEHEQPISSASVQSLNTNADNNMVEEETDSKEEDPSEQPAQHEYPPDYSGRSAVSSDHTGHYMAAAAEETESRPRDVNAILPPYDNSTYYSGVFRSVPELDSRYSAFSQLAANVKLGTTSRPAETMGQSASQEVLNASLYPSSNTVGGQTMSAVNNGPSAMTLPQHSIHPYAAAQPSGLPLAPFANVLGYQYMPPGFSYVQSPYQHNYVGTGNYHQVPAAVGAGAMKYPVAQYKAGGPAVGGMHNTISPSSLGYGGYASTQPASNLPATSGNTSTFEDATAQHYKDSMYMPSQQIDGPSAWLQSHLAREVQGSSYYNVPGQSQPTRYSQAQSLLTHAAHPGAVYGSLYHPQQSGSSPSAHQLLQQQQVLGSMGGLGSQIGSYQQNQRAQPTWASGPY